MRPITLTVESQAISAPIPMDHYQSSFSASLGVVLSGGAVLTYSVQHTLDDIFDSTVTPVWFDNTTLTAKTTSSDGNYLFPVRAVRLNVTAYTSGSATLTVIQAGMPGR